MSRVDALMKKIELGRAIQMNAVRAALQALIDEQRRGVVLADEVGCGKTYEALAIAALLWKHLQRSEPIERVLIVAPPVLMEKWHSEIERPPHEATGFQQYVASREFDGFRRLLGRVHKIDRRDIEGRAVNEDGVRQVPAGWVYLVKPSLLPKERAAGANPLVRWLGQTKWDLVIVDEAHRYTNLANQGTQVFFPDGKVENREKGLTGRVVLALTATPFQLATDEISNLLRLVHADEDDVVDLRDALARYEGALTRFRRLRTLRPDDPARREVVARLEALRTTDAFEGARPGPRGLETMLRRYLIRNVKDAHERRYALVQKEARGHGRVAFEKLDDLDRKLRASPLIPLEGRDALVYLEVRDLLTDLANASRRGNDIAVRERPSFVAGDLRQCLSSYQQLQTATLLRRDHDRAAALRQRVEKLCTDGHPHPKIAAACDVVRRILDEEIAAVRRDPSRHLHKVLVFNGLLRTADALANALSDVVRKKVNAFVRERLRAAKLGEIETAKDRVRDAVHRAEKCAAAGWHDLPRELEELPRDFVLKTAIGAKAGRPLGAVLFARAARHCAQPLFLLGLANHFLAQAGRRRARPTDAEIDRYIESSVTRRLVEQVDDIASRCRERASQDEGSARDHGRRVRRDIERLTQWLASPRYVGRFDGEQEEVARNTRREAFNRSYAPLVLLVSRVGEEGIDLQRHTRYVLHYDVEWNPAKMEQREGRVDREGRLSQDPVDVRFFLLKDTYEERVFHTVMQRDAWFQILIGSKKKELANASSHDPEVASDAEVEPEIGRLTEDERRRVMIDLRPSSTLRGSL